MACDLSHEHSHSHEKSHDLDHNHSHSHIDHQSIPDNSDSDNHHNHEHEHHNRGLTEIAVMILNSDLSDWVKSTALAAFHQLALAEVRVHGSTVDKVHFHEVGAIDSIIDTVGVVIGFELLGITEIHCSPLPVSNGTVWAAHGIMPVPAPATLYLMQGMVLCPGPKGVTGELVTPTGVSLIRALCGMVDRNEYPPYNPSLDILQWGQPTSCSFDASSARQGVFNMQNFRLQRVGVGAGTKDFPNHPNILRILIGTIPSQSAALSLPSAVASSMQEETMNVFSANIDDMTAEALAFACEQLLSLDGCLDVWQEAIVMKKNRSATKLSVLCKEESVTSVSEAIFKHTSSIGLRVENIQRLSLPRTSTTITTSLGPVSVRVKTATLHGRIVNTKAEFDDCRMIAEQTGMSLKEVYTVVNSEIQQVVWQSDDAEK